MICSASSATSNAIVGPISRRKTLYVVPASSASIISCKNSAPMNCPSKSTIMRTTPFSFAFCISSGDTLGASTLCAPPYACPSDQRHHCEKQKQSFPHKLHHDRPSRTSKSPWVMAWSGGLKKAAMSATRTIPGRDHFQERRRAMTRPSSASKPSASRRKFSGVAPVVVIGVQEALSLGPVSKPAGSRTSSNGR